MSWIQTYTGKAFDLLNPTPDMVCTEDIAHALSMICRFNGHTTRFYSVAEHSVMMSLRIEPEYMYEALMHDAAEAYVSDVARPVKGLITGWNEIEHRIESVVREVFGLPEMSTEVKIADLRMLATERRQVMTGCWREWESIQAVDPYSGMGLACWPPEIAEAKFLGQFRALTGKAA